MAVPMQSAAFRSVVEPILNKVFDGLYNQRADEWKQVCREETGTPRMYHEEPVLFGFGAAPELPDGQPVTYRSGGQLYQARFVYNVYGLAFALTKVLVEDGDHISIGKTYSEHLAQSMIETKEILVANNLNRGFNVLYPGGDGVPLISASHPMANGSVWSNVLATPAALSQTSVEQMLIQIRQAVDSTGRKIRLVPRKLVTAPANIMQAEVVLKSVLRSGQGNNDVNPIQSLNLLKEGQANLSRLTSNQAWFIETDAKRGHILFMRRKLQKSMEGDFDTDSMRYKSTERYLPGWVDPRIYYGTPGV